MGQLTLYTRGIVNLLGSRPQATLEDMNSAEALSPLDPLIAPLLAGRGLAELSLGRIDDAVLTTEHAAIKARAHHIAMYPAVIANAMAGDLKRSSKWCEAVLSKRPDSTCAAFFSALPFRDENLIRTFRTALVSSGMPEGD